ETGSTRLRGCRLVRVLPAPPRSRTLTEISRLFAKSPELAGLRAGAWSLRAAKWIPTAISAPLSLASKFRFPATETAPSRERFECAATAGKGVLRLRVGNPGGQTCAFRIKRRIAR